MRRLDIEEEFVKLDAIDRATVISALARIHLRKLKELDIPTRRTVNKKKRKVSNDRRTKRSSYLRKA